MLSSLKTGVKYLLEVTDTNSRFIFLVHGVMATLSMLFLSVVFVFAKDKSGYPEMVLALGGSGGVAAVGRMLTKRDGGGSADALPKPPINP